MNLQKRLINQWIEYTGGSRPRTNFLRFSDIGDRGMLLEIKYVFDWDTGEVTNLRFHISTHEFHRLIEELLERGHAKLEKASEDEKLSFAWRLADDNRIYFQLSGESMLDLLGKSGYRMLDFQELMLGGNLIEMN